jgi:DNA repair protein RecN (Recombination protein N)
VIQKLFIQNYAIIDELEIDFSNRLNIITGETGAGKSIIVGALGLILGERADSTALVNKEKKCFVEGVFDARGKRDVKHFLDQNDLDEGDQLIMRREISTNGKSRAFVNDTPVTLSQLNELTSLLVDLHRQFDTLQLERGDFQREVVDAVGSQTELVSAYQQGFKNWQISKKELETLTGQMKQFEKEFDYNQFQYNELEEAAFKENELEELDKELRLLTNSEGIKAVLSRAQNELAEGENPLVSQLKILISQLQTYSSYHPDLPSLLHRLQSVQIELLDISGEVDRMNDHISHDPQQIEEVDNRLSAGYKLLKKHGVKTTNELLAIKQQLENKLQAALDVGELIELKQRETERLYADARQQAAIISDGRKKQIKPLEQKVNDLLEQVGMPNAKLKVEMTGNGELNFYGSDKIEFLFDANLPIGQAGKSGQFQPIRKVASGGELNRLMLCIKSLVAQSVDLPTMIFDEIDTGISGEAARQVGIIMKGLASKRQIVCITHQPQIAGKADAHFFVYKEVIRNNVKTNIRQLTKEERITAIAKMLSGEKPTIAAMENAREMVMN